MRAGSSLHSPLRVLPRLSVSALIHRVSSRACTRARSFTVLVPGPVVTGISPAVIALGSEATTVTITGSGFQPGATVQLTSGATLATQFIDNGTLQITLDKLSLAQPTTLSFTVVNPLSASSSPISLHHRHASASFHCRERGQRREFHE